VLYLDHIEAHGRQFFDKACELDLEGIVAKRKAAAYRATEKASPYWVKIKNPRYSQAEGRAEFFNPQADGITKV
jgi:ATP-dependent DNA ligase